MTIFTEPSVTSEVRRRRAKLIQSRFTIPVALENIVAGNYGVLNFGQLEAETGEPPATVRPAGRSRRSWELRR